MVELPEPVTVQEALGAPSVDIEVPDSDARWFGPFDRPDGGYHIVEVQRFEDLRDLRMVPENISEQDAADALRADDDAFREQQERLAPEGECSGPNRQARRSHRSLIEVLHGARGRFLEPTDPEVVQVHHHVRRWLERSTPFYVGVARAQNVDVGVNATLVMDSTVHVVHADTVRLASGSRLLFMSGSVNASCGTVSGPNEPDWNAPGPPYSPPVVPRPPLEIPHEPRNITIGKFLPGFSKSVEWHSAHYPGVLPEKGH
ncbi:hypothetical protein AGRA3207_007367 [Actinomadura graeca]|uniref:Uncharacterized protein n=1 Tax=Actinomadura graeca TaxID=2750812 RepID=A0ABX8R7U1_9ACTN|nr:hypothetical protein [Actinomadura graeca]QXJ25812.1 hypothetical protein AGRA3207_007367 [Actinomadura graeca]